VADFSSSRDIIIRTDRWADAVHFYESVLGFPARRLSADMMGFDAGALRLFVEHGAPPHGPVLDFLVPDVAAARARLVAAGCTVIEEDPKLPRCYLRDPFGLVFNIGLTASS
jgi:catechol 2,3-dioxygenase-like lactoylglutathione lyase family enzyme